MVRCMRAGWSREQLGVGLLEKLGHCRGGVGAAWAVGLSAGAYRNVRPWHLDQTGAMQGWCMVWKCHAFGPKPCGLVGEARGRSSCVRRWPKGLRGGLLEVGPNEAWVCRLGLRAVKRADDPRAGPFNRKNFRVRALVFPARLNLGFFGPDRISLRPDRASPRLTEWPKFFFFTNYEKYIQF